MKKYLILAAAVSMFAACTNTDDLTQQIPAENERIPLAIGTSFDIGYQKAHTRGVFTNLQRDTISLSNTVGLFIVSQGTTAGTQNTTELGKEDYEVNNFKLTAPTANTGDYTESTKIFRVLSNSTTNLYYPDNKKEQIALFAYAPHSDASTVTLATINKATTTTPGTDLDASLLTITPETDQSSNENYIKSDLLWGKQGYGNAAGQEVTAEMYKDVTKATSPLTTNTSFSTDATHKGKIILPMKHALSKVTINLFPSGMPLSKLQDATVQIYVDYLDGTMNLVDGTVTKGTKSGTSQLVTLTTHLGLNKAGGTEITTGQDGHPNNISYTGTLPTGLTSGSIEGYSASAVIIPQKVFEGEATTPKQFIKITLKDGSTIYGWNSLERDLSTARSEYIFNIMVTASGLQVTASVENWTSGGAATDGSAELQ